MLPPPKWPLIQNNSRLFTETVRQKRVKWVEPHKITHTKPSFFIDYCKSLYLAAIPYSVWRKNEKYHQTVIKFHPLHHKKGGGEGLPLRFWIIKWSYHNKFTAFFISVYHFVLMTALRIVRRAHIFPREKWTLTWDILQPLESGVFNAGNPSSWLLFFPSLKALS